MADEVIGSSVLIMDVDGSKAIQSMADILSAATAADRGVAAKAGSMADALAGIGAGATVGANATDAATKRYAAMMQRQIASISLSREEFLKYQATVKGVSDTVSGPLIKSLVDAEKAQEALRSKTAATANGLNLVGVSAGQTTQALRQLPAQFTDIVTSLQAGQPAFTVFLQQGGQIKDSFGGVGNALKAIVASINPMMLALGGAAAAIGGVAFAAAKGASEQNELRRQLGLTGQAAGLTETSFNALASSVAGKARAGFGEARDVMLGLAKDGKLSADAMAATATAALLLSKATGESADTIAGQLTGSLKDASKGAFELNQTYNFLTASEYAHIAALQEQGDIQKAVTATMDALAGKVATTTQNLGFLEKAWAGAKIFFAEFLEQQKNIGKELTTAQQIAALQNQIAATKAGNFDRGQLPALESQLEMLRKTLFLENERTAAASRNALANQASIAFLREGEKYLDKAAKKEQEIALAKRQASESQNAENPADRVSEQQLAARLDAINKKYEEKAKVVKSSADAFAAERDAAKDWAKVMLEADKLMGDATASTAGLTKAQAALLGYLSSGTYQTNSAEMRKMAVDRLIDAHNAEVQQAEQKKLNDIIKEGAAAYAKFIETFKRHADSAEQAVETAQDEARAAQLSQAANISLAEAIARVGVERLREKQIAALGNEEVVLQIQREIDAREKLIGLIREKDNRAAIEKQAKALSDETSRVAKDINTTLSSAIVDAFKDGENAGKKLRDSLVNLFENMVLRPTISAALAPVSNAIAGYLTGGQAAGGGSNLLNSASSLYGAGKAGYGWLTGGSSAGGAAAASTFVDVGGYGAATNAALAEYGITSGGTAAAGAGAGASSAASAIPIIGWILAAIAASDAAYKGGNSTSMIGGTVKWGVPGGALSHLTYETLSGLGFSEKWAQVLSGAPLVARLLGHKASSSGYGIGSVVGGDFTPDNITPFQYGDNTLGTGRNTDLEGLSSDLIASVAVAAKEFGGKLQDGLRVGAFTDRDRDGQVAALLGYFGNKNTLTSGVQTGTGAFGLGGPSAAGQKIEGADFQAWVSEQMPLLIVQGLKQSDLDKRFKDYFDSVATADLDASKANELLQTATAVSKLTQAFKPLGGIFTQFGTASVDAVATFAKMAGGVDQLTATTNSYYDNFYTQAEKTDIATKGVRDALAGVGLTMPDLSKGADNARSAWRQMLDAQDLSTESGRQAAVTILNTSGAFADLVANTREGEKKVDEANKAFGDFLDQFKPLGNAFNYLATLPRKFIDAVAEASGGIDRLGGNLSGYINNFFTPAQKADEAFAAVKNSLSAVGAEVPHTNAQFIQLLTTYTKMGAAGAPVVAALLSVQQQFHDFTDFLESDARSKLDSAMALVERSVSAAKDKNTERYNLDTKALDEQEKAARKLYKTKKEQIDLEREAAENAKDLAESTAKAQLKALDEQDKIAKAAYESALKNAEDASKLLDTRYEAKTTGFTKDQIGIDTKAAQDALSQAMSLALGPTGAIDLGSAYDKALASAQDAAKFLEASFDAGTNGSAMLAEMAKAAQNAFDLAGQALQAAIDAASQAVTDLKDLKDSLDGTIRAMVPVGQEQQDRKQAQAQIDQALQAAKSTGALPKADDIREALAAVSKPSQGFFATQTDYLRDFYNTQNKLKQLSGITGVKLTAAEQQLDAIKQQRDDLQKQHDESIKKLDLLRAIAKDQYDLDKKSSTDLIDLLKEQEKTRNTELGVARDAINTALTDARTAYENTVKALTGRDKDAQTQLDGTLEKIGLDREALKDAYDKAQKALDDILTEAKKAHDDALGIDTSVDDVGVAVGKLGTAIDGYAKATGTNLTDVLGRLATAIENFKGNGGGVYTPGTVTGTGTGTGTSTGTGTGTTTGGGTGGSGGPVVAGGGSGGSDGNSTTWSSNALWVDSAGATVYGIDPSHPMSVSTKGGQLISVDELSSALNRYINTSDFAGGRAYASQVGLTGLTVERLGILSSSSWDAFLRGVSTISLQGRDSYAVTQAIRAQVAQIVPDGQSWSAEASRNLRAWADGQGLKASDIDRAMGFGAGYTNQILALYGVPAFAKGINYVPEDMTARIHKGERILPAADNSALMDRLSSPQRREEMLASELKAQRKVIEELKAALNAIALNTGKTAKHTDAMANGPGVRTR